MQLPPVVLLVRDLRVSLVSNYRKWASRYDTEFSRFLRGDPAGRRYNSDLWWCIRFHNAWGRLARSYPTRFKLVRYEDLREEPLRLLAEVAEHLLLPLTSDALDAGVAAATKSAMLARADPARPPGEVNTSDDDPYACYDKADREFVTQACERYMRHTFDYDFDCWRT